MTLRILHSGSLGTRSVRGAVVDHQDLDLIDLGYGSREIPDGVWKDGFLVVTGELNQSYKVWDSEFKVFGSKHSLMSNLLFIAEEYLDHVQFFLKPLLTDFFIHLINFGVILLCFISFFNRRTRVHLWGLGLFLLYVFLYNFHEGLGFPLYGSRYWYPAWAGIALMLARGLEPLLKRRKVSLILGLFVLYQIYLSTEGIKAYGARTTFAIEIKNYLDSKCPVQSIVPIDEIVTDLDHNVPFVFYTSMCGMLSSTDLVSMPKPFRKPGSSRSIFHASRCVGIKNSSRSV